MFIILKISNLFVVPLFVFIYLYIFRMRLSSTVVLILIFSISINNVCTKSKRSKSVTTLLEAKWSVTPLVLEVAEYLADENFQLYWDYIDAISDLEKPVAEIGM